MRVETVAPGAVAPPPERLFREVACGPKVFAGSSASQAAAAAWSVAEVPLVACPATALLTSRTRSATLAVAGSWPDELRRGLGQMTAWMLAARPR